VHDGKKKRQRVKTTDGLKTNFPKKSSRKGRQPIEKQSQLQTKRATPKERIRGSARGEKKEAGKKKIGGYKTQNPLKDGAHTKR